MNFSTWCGFPPPLCNSVADHFDWACWAVREEGGRRCTAAEEWAHLGCGVAPPPGHCDVVAAMADRRGDVVALDCGCQRRAGLPVERGGPEWEAELFSERSGIFGGSLFLPRGGSSAQTGCRLGASK